MMKCILKSNFPPVQGNPPVATTKYVISEKTTGIGSKFTGKTELTDSSKTILITSPSLIGLKH